MGPAMSEFKYEVGLTMLGLLLAAVFAVYGVGML